MEKLKVTVEYEKFDMQGDNYYRWLQGETPTVLPESAVELFKDMVKVRGDAKVEDALGEVDALHYLDNNQKLFLLLLSLNVADTITEIMKLVSVTDDTV